jgi:F0F1-type ATP synthase assembly protein I
MIDSSTPPRRSAAWTRQAAIAMELPFLLVGTVLVGGFFGWLLDRWLSSSPIFTLILGGLGFIAGLRELLRRFNRASPGAKPKSPPSPTHPDGPDQPTDPRP